MKMIITCGILAGVMVSTVYAGGEERLPHEGGRGERGRMEGGGEGERKEGRRGGGGKDGEGMFRRMDQDGDGGISRAEFFSAPRVERLPEEQRGLIFMRLDENGDGVVSRQEIRRVRDDEERERRAMGDFRKLDADGSGGLSFEEFSKGEFFAKLPEERRREIFSRMDTDGSGEITAEDRPKGPPRHRRPR